MSFEKEENDTELNLQRPNTIDCLALRNDDTSKLLLLLADGMDWRDEKKHLVLLQKNEHLHCLY